MPDALTATDAATLQDHMSDAPTPSAKLASTSSSSTAMPDLEEPATCIPQNLLQDSTNTSSPNPHDTPDQTDCHFDKDNASTNPPSANEDTQLSPLTAAGAISVSSQ